MYQKIITRRLHNILQSFDPTCLSVYREYNCIKFLIKLQKKLKNIKKLYIYLYWNKHKAFTHALYARTERDNRTVPHRPIIFLGISRSAGLQILNFAVDRRERMRPFINAPWYGRIFRLQYPASGRTDRADRGGFHAVFPTVFRVFPAAFANFPNRRSCGRLVRGFFFVFSVEFRVNIARERPRKFPVRVEFVLVGLFFLLRRRVCRFCFGEWSWGECCFFFWLCFYDCVGINCFVAEHVLSTCFEFVN